MIFQDGKPYYKAIIPPIATGEVESGIWMDAKKTFEEITEDDDLLKTYISQMTEKLVTLRESGCSDLLGRTLYFLTLGENEKLNLLKQADTDMWNNFKKPQITCMNILRKNNANNGKSSDCIIVGTEEKVILIFEPPRFEIVERFQLSSPIVFVSSYGFFDTEYTLAVVCRDNCIYGLNK